MVTRIFLCHKISYKVIKYWYKIKDDAKIGYINHQMSLQKRKLAISLHPF